MRQYLTPGMIFYIVILDSTETFGAVSTSILNRTN